MTKFTAGKKYYNTGSGSIFYCVGLSSDEVPVFENENRSIFKGSALQAYLNDKLVEYREPKSIFGLDFDVPRFASRDDIIRYIRKTYPTGQHEQYIKRIVEYKEVL